MHHNQDLIQSICIDFSMGYKKAAHRKLIDSLEKNEFSAFHFKEVAIKSKWLTHEQVNELFMMESFLPSLKHLVIDRNLWLISEQIYKNLSEDTLKMLKKNAEECLYDIISEHDMRFNPREEKLLKAAKLANELMILLDELSTQT